MSRSSDLHRRRRKPLEPYFSRLGITRLELMLAVLTRKLIDRLEAFKGTDVVVHLNHVFSAFAGDVIGSICGVEECLLDDPGFAAHL